MYLNNEAEIAIERLLDSSTSPNEQRRHRSNLMGWLSQECLITVQEAREEFHYMDNETLATRAHDLMKEFYGFQK